MSELSVLDRGAGVNGTPQAKGRTGKPRGKAQRKPRGKPRRGLRHARRLAVAVGAVGVGVLGLSVLHCTTAISDLTGSHWLPSALLALGIDAGMVLSEVAEVTAHGSSAETTVRPWARGYTLTAVLLSMGLNAWAFSQQSGMVWAAAALGVLIPGLVYGLGRVAAYLWRAGA
jgi:hypothetical protein